MYASGRHDGEACRWQSCELPNAISSLAESFEPYRRRLLGLAYRMLGSMADAETRCRRHTCAGEGRS
jgi:hypothetical protein